MLDCLRRLILIEYIKYKMLNKVQNQLKDTFQEFRDRSQLCQYYVSFEFPEKQRKMASWWQEKICLAIQYSQEAYLSPADLQVIFTIEGLKPFFLPDILDHLCKQSILEWRGRSTPGHKQGGFLGLGKLATYFWGSSDPVMNLKERQKTLQDSSSRIVSVEYSAKLLNKLTTLIQKCLRNGQEEEHSICYDYVRNFVQPKLQMSQKSLQFLFQELTQKGNIVVENVNGRRVLIYSASPTELGNPLWIQIEKNKYTLRSKIEYFDDRTEGKWREEQALLKQAKEQVNTDKKKARRLLEQARMLSKVAQQFNNRSKLLKQTLSQLQMQQADKITLETLEHSQELISRTMIDVSDMEQVLERNRQIQMAQKETNQNYQQLDQEGLGLEVEQMLVQLQSQIDSRQSKEQKIVEKVDPIYFKGQTQGKDKFQNFMLQN